MWESEVFLGLFLDPFTDFNLLLLYRMLDEVLDGECVELIGTETKIVSSANTELDSTTSASNKV